MRNLCDYCLEQRKAFHHMKRWCTFRNWQQKYNAQIKHEAIKCKQSMRSYFSENNFVQKRIYLKYVVGIRAAGFQKRQHTQKKTMTHGRCQNYRDIFWVIFLFNSIPQKCSLFVPYPWPQFGETPQKKPSQIPEKISRIDALSWAVFFNQLLAQPMCLT